MRPFVNLSVFQSGGGRFGQQSVHLIWTIVGQGPTVLAVNAMQVVWTFFL